MSGLTAVVLAEATGPAAFAADRLRAALAQQGYAVTDGPGEEARVTLEIRPGQLGAEAFAIRRSTAGHTVLLEVTGGDATGAMYGGLQLAEHLRAGTRLEAIADEQGAPRFALRAVKFNLPWMSYRMHEGLQQHGDTCRDLAFWQSYLDMMAESRLNVLSLWNLHPFHLLIRPRNFPEACEFSDEELAEWQAFWRALMRMAHDRGVQVHFFFWNIFVSPAFARAHGVAPYSITWWEYIGDGDTSDLVKRYTRECVTQLIDEYPDLDGLGVAMSERMGGMTPEERGAWVFETIVEGIRAASRPVQFNLRVPHSAGLANHGTTSPEAQSLGRRLLEAVDLPGALWTEVKFNWSHGHSTPNLCLIHGGKPTDALWNPPPTAYRLAWMVRNEDFFVLRWGDPAFVRAHIAQNGIPGVGGYFIGSECYIPADDYLTRPSEHATWRYAFERQWLFYQLWGRLLYDPATPDGTFAAQFDARYGGAMGGTLLPALALASRTPERIATFVGFTWDHTLYTEGFLRREGFITVEQLATCTPVDPNWMSVAEYVAAGAPTSTDRLTPLALAEAQAADARAALAAVADFGECAGPLRYEVADIRAWAHLGLYFAAKLRAAVALQRSQTVGSTADRMQAAEYLRTAAGHWDDLVAVTEPLYLEAPLQHTGDRPFSWRAYRDEVRQEAERLMAEPVLEG